MDEGDWDEFSIEVTPPPRAPNLDPKPTPESYPQQQEQARQAAYQPSQNASRSEPTCVFCDRPGMHQTASGLMCGIHLHHLM